MVVEVGYQVGANIATVVVESLFQMRVSSWVHPAIQSLA
jgi:hypothetical protein